MHALPDAVLAADRGAFSDVFGQGGRTFGIGHAPLKRSVALARLEAASVGHGRRARSQCSQDL